MNRKITPIKFYSIFLMHPFYGGNGRASVILFADDEIIKFADETKK